MKALVIDDSKVMRNMLRAYLSDFGIETNCAEDGLDALEKVTVESEYDFALVDWDMPRMTGIEFVKEVRSKSELQSMKLLMVTAHTAMEDVGQALHEGANDFLMKPFSKEMVEEKLSIMGLLN
ncbi:MAG: hypothetical protein CBD18_06320 [Opitutales bacterium TMED158]|nr:MAG: hypothetical protein CBD18_06320 [Opitutales bacterium TMED158]